MLLQMEQRFPFWYVFGVRVGVCIVILAISTTENAVPELQRLTIKLDKCQAEFYNCERSENKTITMHEMTM